MPVPLTLPIQLALSPALAGPDPVRIARDAVSDPYPLEVAATIPLGGGPDAEG